MSVTVKSFSATRQHTPYGSCPTCGYVFSLPISISPNAIAQDVNSLSPFPVPSHINPNTGSLCISANAVQSFYIAVHYAVNSVYVCLSTSIIPDSWWLT